MRKKSANEQAKIETGEKFGSLTVICLARHHGEYILICQCDCCQIVKLSEAELKTRAACLRCEEIKELANFKTGDIALYRCQFEEIPFGEQVIVNDVLDDSLEIEYRGRLYTARSGELENLGVNFYDRKRVKKIR